MDVKRYSPSRSELSLIQQISVPLNRCNIPSWLLASLDYQHHPVPIEIDCMDTWYAKLFVAIAKEETAKNRAELFKDFMAVRFNLAKNKSADPRPRPKINYRRLLLGWLFDSDNEQGAAWRSWVESRFGLLTRFHEESVPGPESEAYARFRQKCTRALYNTNELYEQLDLLYCFCQQELKIRHPEQDHITLYRGCIELPEHEIDGLRVKLFNNLSSFTADPEDALRFGSRVFSVEVPLSKIACFDSLLPGSLSGEQEYMVLGGLYQVEQFKF